MQLSKMNIYGIYTWTNLGNNFRNYKRRIRSSRLGITSDVTLVSQKCICTDFLWNQVDYLSLFLAVTPLRERYLQRNILFIRKKGEPINSPSSDPVGIRTQDLRLRRPLLYPAELPNQVSFNFNGAKIVLSPINTNIRSYFFRLKWTLRIIIHNTFNKDKISFAFVKLYS